MPDV